MAEALEGKERRINFGTACACSACQQYELHVSYLEKNNGWIVATSDAWIAVAAVAVVVAVAVLL